MSKQSEARAHQGYIEKPAPATCCNCVHFRSDRALPAWMEREKVDWRGKPFTLAEHGTEKNLRCAAGEFAVKKMATCRLFERKEEG